MAVFLKISSLLSGDVSVICSSRHNVGFFCVWKNLQEFICIPLKKISGSRHFA